MHVSNNINFTEATCRDAVFQTTPTVCFSVPSIVEVSHLVSGGLQSVNRVSGGNSDLEAIVTTKS